MTLLRVLLVDDHEVVRMGLRMLLEGKVDVQVVAEAGTADEAISACEQTQPDAVIMDIRMPGNSGIDACHAITSRWPQTQVIMLDILRGRQPHCRCYSRWRGRLCAQAGGHE